MPRETWVYPEKGEPYLKGDGPPNPSRGPMIMGDLPDFVSPIDQRAYSGRAGLREHCAVHNVVPTADLAGLPIRTTGVQETRSPGEIKRDAETRRRVVIEKVNQHYR